MALQIPVLLTGISSNICNSMPCQVVSMLTHVMLFSGCDCLLIVFHDYAVAVAGLCSKAAGLYVTCR